MKKWIALTLALLLCLSVLSGCGGEKAEESAPTSVGGWTVSESWEMDEKTQAIFDKALEGLTGVSYEPLACLGSQLVAGMNYCFFCRARVAYPDARPYYALVYVYEDLEGKAEITDILSMTPCGELNENAGSSEQLAGGWSVPETEEEGLAAFEKAMQGRTEAAYEPICVLGSQVVAGMNYCVLCRVGGEQPHYELLRIYRDLSGGAELSESSVLALAR